MSEVADISPSNLDSSLCFIQPSISCDILCIHLKKSRVTIYSLYPNLEPVCYFMSSSNCCFLTCIQNSQEAGQVTWYSHLLKNFPQFIVVHTVQGFGIVNKAEVDVFLELTCLFNDPIYVGNLISVSSAFSKFILKFMVQILLKLALENFEHYFGSI